MTDYIVTADRHRVVTREKNEVGDKITRTKIYRRGDKVSMSPDDADRLVRSGGLRPADQEGGGSDVGARLPNSAVPATTGDRVESPGALSGQVADEGLRDATKPSPEAVEAHQVALAAAEQARQEFHAAQGTEGDQDNVPDDGYDDLDYPALQAEAKSRDLEHTGKKKEIIARLRADDADADQGDGEDDDTGGDE